MKKIVTSPLSDHFEEYVGGPDFHLGCQFIKGKFMERVDKNLQPSNPIWVHFTCALDTKGIEVVMGAVKTQLLDEVIEEIGIQL